MVTDKIIVILFVVGLIALCVIPIIQAEIQMRREKKINERSPLLTDGKVVDERVVNIQVASDAKIQNAYYITCEFEDRTRRETRVYSSEWPLSDWNRCHMGTKGY
ncbi:hypothetical protein ACM1RC_28270 [Paenibacillus azoreducens]|uniref:hypothetical protein n=1 Tax=Paenibacillus azoreducens TaxID=116718 RepID=UPI0039F497B0